MAKRVTSATVAAGKQSTLITSSSKKLTSYVTLDMQHCQPQTAIQMLLVFQLQMEKLQISQAVSSICRGCEKIPPLNCVDTVRSHVQWHDQYLSFWDLWFASNVVTNQCGMKKEAKVLPREVPDFATPLLMFWAHCKSLNAFQVHEKSSENCSKNTL